MDVDSGKPSGTEQFEVIDEGFIYRADADDPPKAAVGSRCALTNSGEVVCSFMATSALGVNDFVPMLSWSLDGGQTWSEVKPIWPELEGKFSITASISQSQDGELFLFGSRTPIDKSGEPFWSPETLGAKQNELIWARSNDGGHNWSLPQPFSIPLAGAAEAPAPLCVTRSGRWLAPYSPSPTFDPDLDVDRGHVVVMISDNQGESFHHASMLSFTQNNSGAGESWVIELADGRLLATCWQFNLGEGDDFPNPYVISEDQGNTWGPTCYSPIMGQSTALAALPDGRALFVYNQRVHDVPGIWLAVVNPTNSDFGIEAHQIIWRAETPTQSGSSGCHEQWDDFAFGEPSITWLPDHTLLATLWCQQPSGHGIRFVKLKVDAI